MAINFNLNGAAQEVEVAGEMPLLWALRDILHLCGTKYGCGIGACGSCAVHLDGEAVRACITPMSEVEGRSVTTIEGLSSDGTHPLQRAWQEHDVPQCGYCQAGQIMQAAALLASGRTVDDQAIDETMSDSVCRCGTYQRIRAAILDAAGQGGQG